MIEQHAGFVAYEYQERTVEQRYAPYYKDGYGCFGWQAEQQPRGVELQGRVTLRLRRDRHIPNKTELTRLQRHFEACADEIQQLERSQSSVATLWALVTGIIGTAFMAGSVFAVTHVPPLYWLCVLLAVPGFSGWIAPYFIYRRKAELQARKVQPLIEAKQDEIYEICEKGHSLL